MAHAGHDMPDKNSNGTDVKTKINIHVSRLRTKTDRVIAKKMHASTNGNMNARNEAGCPTCGRLNIHGTTHSTYMLTTS